MRYSVVPFLLLSLLMACGSKVGQPLDNGHAGQLVPEVSWRVWGGDPGGRHFSPLAQINTGNVGSLQLAWTYRTGEVFDTPDARFKQMLATTPLMVAGSLYLCSARDRVIALDAASGHERWVFDPAVKEADALTFSCRGVAYWSDQGDKPCSQRVLFGTYDARLIALDANTGQLCLDFGQRGVVDLAERMGALAPAEYNVTSPPTLIGDLVVVGARVADNRRVDAPSGVVRAFDVRSGALRWYWNPVPPGQNPLDSAGHYVRGTPNAWGVFSIDEALGLVFVPTGNASPDSFGGRRQSFDHFGSSIVALDSQTGEVRWRFQTVHHDLWDYDVAAQPSLFTLRRDGEEIPALLLATKTGMLYVLDRRTGKPLFPVTELRVPQQPVAGDYTSPTQPVPKTPVPLVALRFGKEDVWGFTFLDRASCRRQMDQLRSDGIFTPPSEGGSVQFPGSLGGINWGGVTIDEQRRIVIVNLSHAAMVTRLRPKRGPGTSASSPGAKLDNGGEMAGTPYASNLYPLTSFLGAPCNPPPWGELLALDLDHGDILWRQPFGTTRDIMPIPLPFGLPLGVPNIGGALVTAGGLTFIGATTDSYFRAFDTASGALLWEQRLPAAANASPLTYRTSAGVQYVVIAAGGHVALPGRKGDYILGFRLSQ